MTNKLLEGLDRFGPETYSTQMPFKMAKALEDTGLIQWVGTYLGTQQWALTDAGRAKLSQPQPSK